MTSFAHTGSTFKKVFAAWYMQNLVLYSLRRYQTLKFQWRHSRIPEVLSKKFLKPDIIPLFTGENCALILLIVAEISDIEIFNDVIRAYRKYFRKSCLQTKCVEMDSVLPATNCSSISLTVLMLFAFKVIYDVIFVNRKSHKNGKRYVVFDDTLLNATES